MSQVVGDVLTAVEAAGEERRADGGGTVVVDTIADMERLTVNHETLARLGNRADPYNTNARSTARRCGGMRISLCHKYIQQPPRDSYFGEQSFETPRGRRTLVSRKWP